MVKRHEKEFVRGKTVDEKFEHINATLKHFSKRLRSVVVGVIPASPVYDFVFVPESDGVVLRSIFPVAGRIIKSAIFVGSHDGKGSTVVTATIENNEESRSTKLEVKKVPLIFDLDQTVKAGDRLTLTVDEPEKVRGIWYAFLYEAELRSMTRKTFMVDEFERLLEEGLEDAGEE